MAEAPKLLYVVVVEEEEDGEAKGGSFCYTRPVLQSTLQLMGCKARHAFKISRRVFEVTRSEFSLVGLGDEVRSSVSQESTEEGNVDGVLAQIEASTPVRYGERSSSVQFELYKRQTTVVIHRDTFLDVVCDALSQYKYVGPNQRADLALACRLRERKTSVTVLLCGTSGCGKSTLSTLLASRLGITTVVSTDSIRHMMRSFVDEKDNPLVWSSTYHAGEHLDPVEVAKAKARRKAKKLSSTLSMIPEDELVESDRASMSHSQDAGTELISKKQMAIEGYKAQSEMVIDGLDRLITSWEHQKESVIVEGVHLSLNFVMGLMKRHPSIIPFMLYISNEEKHMERFAVRAKYMTLDPSKNKYVKYIRNIRTIQEYLCNRADKHLVPKVNNSNVDRSVAAIHATVFSCLRRRETGEQLYDLTTNTVPIIEEEYRGQCTANTSSSKGMFQLIQRQGSSRHLMALVNTDGSVAKAWPVESFDDAENPKLGNGNGKSMSGPLYGPLQIGKAEPVNLQFGCFGMSAWPSDVASTSHTGSIDESGAGGTDTGSRYYSSCCSSPRLSMSDVPAKELKEGSSVSGSDEDAIDPQHTDEDLSDIDDDRRIHEEIEGSVDEESTKSDEEYDDLAMRDDLENGYWSDEDEPAYNQRKKTIGTKAGVIDGFDLERYNRNLEMYNRNLGPFLEASRECVDPACFHSPLSSGRFSRSADGRLKMRSLSASSEFLVQPQSIPTLDKQESAHVQGTILTAAP